MKIFGIQQVYDPELWKEGTWIERDVESVLTGVTDEYWREYPDVDVLAFIHFEETDKVPILWIDGQCFFYSEAMKHIKKATKKKPEPLIIETPEEIKHAV